MRTQDLVRIIEYVGAWNKHWTHLAHLFVVFTNKHNLYIDKYSSLGEGREVICEKCLLTRNYFVKSIRVVGQESSLEFVTTNTRRTYNRKHKHISTVTWGNRRSPTFSTDTENVHRGFTSYFDIYIRNYMMLIVTTVKLIQHTP